MKFDAKSRSSPSRSQSQGGRGRGGRGGSITKSKNFERGAASPRGFRGGDSERGGGGFRGRGRGSGSMDRGGGFGGRGRSSLDRGGGFRGRGGRGRDSMDRGGGGRGRGGSRGRGSFGDRGGGFSGRGRSSSGGRGRGRGLGGRGGGFVGKSGRGGARKKSEYNSDEDQASDDDQNQKFRSAKRKNDNPNLIPITKRQNIGSQLGGIQNGYNSEEDEGSDDQNQKRKVKPIKKKKENPNFIQLKRENKKNPIEEELEIAPDDSLENQFRNFKETQNFQDENESDDEEEAPTKEGGVKKIGKKKTGGFQSMGLSALVLKGILRRGYKVPTPIQRKTIPLILEGKDVVAMARTGSGKTAAFLIPLFEKLHINRTAIGSTAKFPRAIILSPTRELAMQTVKFFREIGRFVNLKVAGILGGESMESQFQIIHDKPDVIIATPGRFMHLCVEMELKLDGVEYIVFDEADRLFEMGFGEQVTEIVRRLPEARQTVLFSATLPKLLVEFTKAGLHDPSLIRLDVDSKLPDMLELVYLACRSEDKLAALMYLIKNFIDEKEQTIVFAATKHHVEFIHQLLDEQDISNCYIYSSLDPAARKISIAKFRTGKCNVMVVTDIAARGIDIPVLDNVINFHFPAKPKLFMHRVGRVARAGRSGKAYSIVSPDEISFLLDLHLFLNRPLKFNVTAKESDDAASVVGRIPQDVLNEENGILTNLITIKAELETISKTCRNGYQQYLKSRPNASTESNRRAKDIEVSRLAVHPTFAKHIKEDPMDTLISQIHTYRPNSTIFEIGPKSSSETHRIMKIKRTKDQSSVEKFRLTKSNSMSINNDEAMRAENSKKDEENFIPYLPKDHLTETGLCVGTTFDKQIQESVMDITGDDSDMLKNQRHIMKWDQKKKKFISTGKDTKAKKIKTESGAWIAASYKSDRYKSWKEKSKVEQQSSRNSDGDDDDEADDYTPKGSNPLYRSAAFSKRLVKTGKNDAPGGARVKGVKFNTELKRPEQILKDRKEKEKKKLKNTSKSSKKKGKKGGSAKGGNSSFRKKK